MAVGPERRWPFDRNCDPVFSPTPPNSNIDIAISAMTEPEGPEQILATIGDWLRYAVTRFNKAELAFGHGTTTALDEAAFLILHTLRLPIDRIDPWLDARLLPAERLALSDIVHERISSRKPAAYLTREAWIGGSSFYVDERVIVPRSYIGELLGDGLAGVVSDPGTVRNVLDLCTGSGCLAILAALTFPEARVDASDVSDAALAVAARNVADYALEDRITLVESDLFHALGGRQYELMLVNPPYVSREKMAAFPPEYAAEPVIAHDGGGDGLDIVRRILAEAPAHLTPEGVLVAEIGTGRKILERDYPKLPFMWLDTENSQSEVLTLHRASMLYGATRR